MFIILAGNTNLVFKMFIKQTKEFIVNFAPCSVNFLPHLSSIYCLLFPFYLCYMLTISPFERSFYRDPLTLRRLRPSQRQQRRRRARPWTPWRTSTSRTWISATQLPYRKLRTKSAVRFFSVYH